MHILSTGSLVSGLSYALLESLVHVFTGFDLLICVWACKDGWKDGCTSLPSAGDIVQRLVCGINGLMSGRGPEYTPHDSESESSDEEEGFLPTAERRVATRSMDSLPSVIL